MISRATLARNFDLHKAQQIVKWAVYIFLLINWGFYIVEDWTRAAHTLTADSTFLDWTSEFATSIDESAWFILLFMFELETYILEDEEWTGWVGHTVRGIRLLCIAMIAHTVYAFFIALINIQPTVPVENVSNLCEMTSADVSFVYNLEYTEVTEETCGELSDATQFFWVADNPVVSDAAGPQTRTQPGFGRRHRSLSLGARFAGYRNCRALAGQGHYQWCPDPQRHLGTVHYLRRNFQCRHLLGLVGSRAVSLGRVRLDHGICAHRNEYQ